MRAAVFHEGRHVTQAEVYPATRRCPVCLDEAWRPAVLRLQESPTVEMLRCGNCRACSASHMPRPEILDEYYRAYYAGKPERLTCPNSDGLARHILRFLAAPADTALDGPPAPRARILDFGGGDGTVAGKVARGLLTRGPSGRVDVDLVDYEKPRESVADGVRLRGHSSLDEVDGRYDLVIASAVLEHVPQLNPVMRKLFGLVVPGGYFYARTPYILPLARLVKAMDITYPAHVHDMGSQFWDRVRETFGLDATLVRSAPSPVETTLAAHPLRTIAAGLLKAPARLEQWLRPRGRRDHWWRLVGGWEVVLRFHGQPPAAHAAVSAPATRSAADPRLRPPGHQR